MKLDLEWVNNVQVNLSAVERRTATLIKRRSVKKEYQAAWLLKAITLIDLTTLSGDDTYGKVDRLCEKAIRPLSFDPRKFHIHMGSLENEIFHERCRPPYHQNHLV